MHSDVRVPRRVGSAAMRCDNVGVTMRVLAVVMLHRLDVAPTRRS
jgi:hypothetical protein